MAAFSRSPVGTSFGGVASTLTMEDLPRVYLALGARVLPTYDLERVRGAAAVTQSYLKSPNVWAVDTGRSIRSWATGVNSVPAANANPGPSARGSFSDALQDSAAARPGDTIIVANRARRPGDAGSYAGGIWIGAYSRKTPPGLEGRLAAHLMSQESFIDQRAQDIAVGML